MKIDELNKNQLILLSLLISFVTSIATGIVTVTLMDQAPPAVTRTVNRIVERTVERVVPGETQVSTVIKEVPVIVTEEELIVKVINNASPAIVKIVSAGENPVQFGSGFLFDEGTKILTKKSFLFTPASLDEDGDEVPAKPREFRVWTEEGEEIAVGSEARLAAGADLAVLSVVGDSVDWPSTTLAERATTIGQTVVALGYDQGGELGVSVGIVSSLTGSASTTPQIRTNATGQGNLGGPLLNIDGAVIGLNAEAGVAIPAEFIQAFIDSQV